MNLKEKLKTLGTNNPKQFWEIIKQLKNDHNDNANPIDFIAIYMNHDNISW